MKNTINRSARYDYDLVVEQLKTNYMDDIIEKCDYFSNMFYTNKSMDDRIVVYSELVRVIHSAKGTSVMYGIPEVGKICHDFEDFLQDNDIGNNLDETYIDVIIKYLDSICVSLLARKNELVIDR